MRWIGSSLRGAISPSMIVALIALFVALGGAAYAKQSQQQNVLSAQIVTRVTASQSVSPGSWRSAISLCPSGYRAIGGGSQHIHDYSHPDDWDTVETGPVIAAGTPPAPYPWWPDREEPQRLPAANGWAAAMRNVGPAAGKFTVAAVCARVVVDQR